MGMALLSKFRWFQSRPKTAWCCRWVLGSAAVLTLAAWVVSLFSILSYWAPGTLEASIFRGRVTASSDPLTDTGQTLREKYREFKPGVTVPLWSMEEIRWYLKGGYGRKPIFALPNIELLSVPGVDGRVVRLDIPLWLIFALTAPLALAAWRNRWVVKREVGTCPSCGYSRTGLAPSAPCPECGTAPTGPLAKT